MRYQKFLIKYAEIGTKGKNRYKFEDLLLQRLKETLQGVEGGFKVYKTQGRMYATPSKEYNYDDVMEAISRVFGVSHVCPIKQVFDKGFDVLKQEVVDFIGEEYEDKNFTFKVMGRRTRKNYPLDSMELAAKIGEALLEAYPEMKVDVHNPDVYINVEIRDSEINIYSKTHKGPGGMPVGCNGTSMLLLSGGIDSPVAGWMCSKRGVALEATYFHAPPYTSDRAKQKVIDLAKIVSRYSGPIKLHIVNFTDIQLKIYETCPHEELTIIMRRYMMRIAQKIAEAEGCEALITGESIGQVASQTVKSLVCTNEVCEMPVFRPLIAFDKMDIVEISERIGAYETSIQPFEDCCTIFVAKHPVTKPLLEKIKKSEELLEGMDEMIEKALAETEVVIARADD